MWRLVDMTTLQPVGPAYWDQAEACESAYHENGKPIRRAEAMQLKDGDVIYRRRREKKFIKRPVIDRGQVVAEEARTTASYGFKPYRLMQMR